MLTEDEAKERWCPHARVPLYAAAPNPEESPVAANRPPPGAKPKVAEEVMQEMRCIGSGCMSWRWAALPRTVMAAGLTEAERAVLAATRPTGYIEYRSDDEKPRPLPRHGYCGLAGKP